MHEVNAWLDALTGLRNKAATQQAATQQAAPAKGGGPAQPVRKVSKRFMEAQRAARNKT